MCADYIYRYTIFANKMPKPNNPNTALKEHSKKLLDLFFAEIDLSNGYG